MVGTPKTQKLGPGELTLTLDDSVLDLSCQLTAVTVTWNSDEEDDVPVLCGGVLPGDSVDTATLEGTVYQDLTADGVIDFTWKHRGKTANLAFTPTAGKAKITGVVKVRPVNFGGDAGKRNTADIAFPFVGAPDFVPLDKE